MMRIVKDDSCVGTYGKYLCRSCGLIFHGGGPAIHKSLCPDKEKGYEPCDYLVGPNCKEYEMAEEP